MATFLLDTDSVLNVSKGMDTLSSNVDTILGNVKGYDVSNDDFDFSGAKNSIVNNIEGIETKVSNTNVLLDTVVQVHSELQESISDINGDTTSTASTNTVSTSSTSSTGVSADYSYSTASDGNYKESNTDTGNYGYGGVSDQSYYAVPETASKAVEAQTVKEVNEIIEEKIEDSIEEKTDADVSTNVVSSIIDEQYKEVLENTKFEESTVNELLNTIKDGEMCVVVEGNSLDLKTIEYLSVVAKAAMSVSAILRFVKLDNILDFKTNNTASDLSESTKNVLSEDKKTNEKESTEKDKTSTTDTKDKKEETKVEALNYTVKNKALFDSLSSIKCNEGIEISYEKLPITLIIKNNKVLSFKKGIISEDELRKELLRINVIPTIKT